MNYQADYIFRTRRLTKRNIPHATMRKAFVCDHADSCLFIADGGVRYTDRRSNQTGIKKNILWRCQLVQRIEVTKCKGVRRLRQGTIMSYTAGLECQSSENMLNKDIHVT